jgi:hypothetical protein
MSETSETVQALRREVAHAVDEAMCGYDPDVLRGLVLRLGAAVLTALPEMAPSAAATEDHARILAALTRRAEEAESEREAFSQSLSAVTERADTLRAAAEAWADARRAIETSRGDRAQIRASEQYDDAIRALLAVIGRGPAGTVTP